MRPIVTKVTAETINQFYVFEASLRKLNPDCELFVFTDELIHCSGTVIKNQNIREYMSIAGYESIVCIDCQSLVLEVLDELHNATIPEFALARILPNDLILTNVIVMNTRGSDTHYSDLGWFWNQGCIPDSARSHSACIDMRYENCHCGILDCTQYNPQFRHRQSRYTIMFPFELYYEFASLVKEKLDADFWSNVSYNAHNHAHMVIYMNNIFNKFQKEPEKCLLT